jgi:hypothetical protein
MLLLGVVQAQAAGDVSFGSYDLLATTILTSSAASVTFSSLGDYATNYQHLQIRYAARTSVAGNGDGMFMRMNSDTGSNYARHYLQGTGSAVQSDAATSQTSITNFAQLSGNNSTANDFAAGVIDILDPFETTKNTTIRALSGQAGSETRIRLGSGFYNNTASITTIFLATINSANFLTGSRFSLYGLRK